MMGLSDFLNVNTYITLASILLIIMLFLFSKKSAGVRKAFIVMTILYNIIYLSWRTLFTLPFSLGTASAIVGVILLLAEYMGFFQSIVFRILFWKTFTLPSPPLFDADKSPTVDVFIATYNENSKILKKTVAGCLNLDYPKDRIHIYLCDDGRRQEIRELCEEFKIHYITRDTNESAKAGNINNALKSTNGELVVLLDADMVPKSSFLQKTVGYFLDDKVGFVQTPQIFYNPDPFQFNLRFGNKIPNEQDFFMMDIQGSRASFNAVLHVGTNAVFRRKAIDDIKGIPTGTITEDMATGMLIQAKGFRSVFVKEVLCTGLSVESFGTLVKQRERWCRGNIQVFKKWNPLFLKGLTPMQRLIYLDGFVYWFFGIQKIIYVLCPLLYLIFGLILFNASASQLLMFWMPSFIASNLAFRLLSNKRRSMLWSHIYEIATAPFIALASTVELLFSRPVPFLVTPKGTKSDSALFSWKVASPQLFLAAATLLGWVISGMIILRGDTVSFNSLTINLSWSVYNVFAIILSILVCLERPRKRSAERLCALIRLVIHTADNQVCNCRIMDISEDGISVVSRNTSLYSLEDKAVVLDIETIGRIHGEIVWAKIVSGEAQFGIRFSNTESLEYRKLVKFVSDHNQGYHDNCNDESPA